MQNSTLRKVSELSSDVRTAIEGLLGRTLQENETVSISAYQPHPAPAQEAREKAFRRLIEHSDQIAARVKNVPEEEVDAALDEAIDYVRHHPE